MYIIDQFRHEFNGVSKCESHCLEYTMYIISKSYALVDCFAVVAGLLFNNTVAWDLWFCKSTLPLSCFDLGVGYKTVEPLAKMDCA